MKMLTAMDVKDIRVIAPDNHVEIVNEFYDYLNRIVCEATLVFVNPKDEPKEAE